MTDTALHSLFGAGHHSARRERRDPRMLGTREQTVYTPIEICDAWRQVWPEGIALDPCSADEPVRAPNPLGHPLGVLTEIELSLAADAVRQANQAWTAPAVGMTLADLKTHLSSKAYSAAEKALRRKSRVDLGSPGHNALVRAERTLCLDRGEDGLVEPWVDRTFINPPYATLKPWLQKAYSFQGELGVLLPLRPQRKWFQLDRFDAACFHDPVTFYNAPASYPGPIVSVYKGARVEAFVEAFGPLGRVVRVQALT